MLVEEWWIEYDLERRHCSLMKPPGVYAASRQTTLWPLSNTSLRAREKPTQTISEATVLMHRPFGIRLTTWQKRFIVPLILIVLGLVVWSQRIGTSHGFLMDDCRHLAYSYANNLKTLPLWYLPGVPVHRPIGKDAFTILLRLFGEKDIPIIRTLLLVHIVSSVFIWLAIERLTSNSLASLAGVTFFLLSESAYLPIYWPGAIFDLLSTFFLASLLLSVTCIVRPRGEYHPWLLMLTLPLLVAAIKTKESTIVVVIPLFLLVFFAHLGVTQSPGHLSCLSVK